MFSSLSLRPIAERCSELAWWRDEQWHGRGHGGPVMLLVWFSLFCMDTRLCMRMLPVQIRLGTEVTVTQGEQAGAVSPNAGNTYVIGSENGLGWKRP